MFFNAVTIVHKSPYHQTFHQYNKAAFTKHSGQILLALFRPATPVLDNNENNENVKMKLDQMFQIETQYFNQMFIGCFLSWRWGRHGAISCAIGTRKLEKNKWKAIIEWWQCVKKSTFILKHCTVTSRCPLVAVIRTIQGACLFNTLSCCCVWLLR